jgi:yeast amino acid transporter
MSIPVITYGFLGVEIVSVTAFEAKDRTALRLPAKYIAYIIASLYLLCSLLEAVDVYFNDPNLPRLHDRSAATGLARRSTGPGPGFYAAIVIAARQYGSPAAGWFFNGCIIYFCISASNTALYVSSRTLYGLTRELNRLEQPDRLQKVLSYLGLTTPYRHVPFWALIISFFSFCWLPILQVRGGLASQDVSR